MAKDAENLEKLEEELKIAQGADDKPSSKVHNTIKKLNILQKKASKLEGN